MIIWRIQRRALALDGVGALLPLAAILGHGDLTIVLATLTALVLLGMRTKWIVLSAAVLSIWVPLFGELHPMVIPFIFCSWMYPFIIICMLMHLAVQLDVATQVKRLSRLSWIAACAAVAVMVLGRPESLLLFYMFVGWPIALMIAALVAKEFFVLLAPLALQMVGHIATGLMTSAKTSVTVMVTKSFAVASITTMKAIVVAAKTILAYSWHATWLLPGGGEYGVRLVNRVDDGLTAIASLYPDNVSKEYRGAVVCAACDCCLAAHAAGPSRSAHLLVLRETLNLAFEVSREQVKDIAQLAFSVS